MALSASMRYVESASIYKTIKHDGADAVEVDAQDMADVFVGLALFRCRF